MNYLEGYLPQHHDAPEILYWDVTPRANTRSESKTPARFVELKTWWQNDTAFSSGGPSLFMHPAYQQIIGLGWPAVRVLLAELRDQPDHWFWALSAITGVDAAAGKTSFAEARDAWLAWGGDRGLLE
ncbi:hypothetical protein B0I12_002585 [Microbacterium hydrothermale]|uniref:hypothetical protein n=1 Tax=Microbacterium hydrothermale TaxID=857427 RepID=UPI002225C6DC|nr:hypothetical protein [Microbacterium hydrothermale]MCW2165430.1 hypothetical protein [Microbacterium hydrothermale]